MCDIAYVMQVRELEREVHAVWMNAPHLPAGSDMPTMEGARSDFDAWLASEPVKRQAAAVPELAGLSEVLGVARVGR